MNCQLFYDLKVIVRSQAAVVISSVSTYPPVLGRCCLICATHIRSQRLPVETNIGPVSGNCKSSLFVFKCIRTCDARSCVAVIVSVAILLQPKSSGEVVLKIS